MSLYEHMGKEQLEKEIQSLEKQFNEFKSRGLQLNMSRGNPSKQQLDLSNDIFTRYTLAKDLICTEEGFDSRNYGCLDGLIEAKRMMAQVLEVPAQNIIIGGNSSLNLMYDTIARAMLFGVYGSEKPWCKYDSIKFLCPVPGYDRHFGICEDMGIEMINVPMNSEGPDMDLVERLVEEDDTIKGIWCVPMYSNPEGITYSDETVKRFAALKPAAKDFRIFWDNAYCIHHLQDDHDTLLNIFDECRKAGNEDIVYIFASFSKVTYPGAAISAVASSENNLKEIRRHLAKQTIGSDKINQLRHVKYFKDIDGLKAHMLKQREIIKPKFDLVISALEKEISPLGIASWSHPKGGYFVSVNTLNGCAKRVVDLCRDGGVILTAAGATYPYGKDPDDKNIRIAPTFPPEEELQTAMKLFCIALKLASAERAMNR